MRHGEVSEMVEQHARMTLEWSVPPGELTVINAALNSLMITTRQAPGCVSCVLSTQLGDRAGLQYIEEWKTEADLINQLRSSRFSKLAHLMEGATEPPHIEFSVHGETLGIEYAEQARQQGNMP